MPVDSPLNERDRAAQRHFSLSRRAFLRGLGVCVALPALESLRPLRSVASVVPHAAAAQTDAPIRMAFMEFPNGALPQYWWPTGQPGQNFELNRTMQPLQSVKSKV